MSGDLGDEVRLDDLCKLVAEQIDPRSNPETLYIGLEHLQPGRITRSDGGRSREVLSSKSVFRKGDILYGKLRPYLDKVIIADDDGVCSTELLVLRPKEEIDPRFLTGILHSAPFIEHAMSGVTGVQHPRTSWQRLREFRLPKFEIMEQHAIGEVVGEVQRSIAACEATIAVTEKIKGEALNSLFRHGLHGEPQKDTELGLVPESWQLVRLRDCATAISKGSSPKWQGFDYVPSGVLFVRSQNVGDGVMDWRDMVFLSPEWNDKERRSILHSGDVLINLVGASIGRVALGDRRIEGANCNQAVCFVRLSPSLLVGQFLVGFLLSAYGQRQVHGQKKDIARANLSLEDVREFLIPCPPIVEQTEIANILAALEQKLSILKRKLTALEKLFKEVLSVKLARGIRVAGLKANAPLLKHLEEDHQGAPL